MKWLAGFLSVFFLSGSFAQFVPSIGTKLGIINSSTTEVIGIYSRPQFSGEQFDYYYINNTLGNIAGGFHLRGFGSAFLSEKKVRPGYSLEMGVQQFKSDAIFVYHSSSTNDPDSIVNDFDHEHRRIDYTTVQFKHFFDLHWNISDDLKWTNSLGVGIMAMVRAKTFGTPQFTIIDNDRPVVLTFTYDCQFTEKYKNIDVGYFLSFDFYSIPLFKDDEAVVEANIKLRELQFIGLGFRVIPHLRMNERITDSH